MVMDFTGVRRIEQLALLERSLRCWSGWVGLPLPGEIPGSNPESDELFADLADPLFGGDFLLFANLRHKI
jgi:hypothetical protein